VLLVSDRRYDDLSWQLLPGRVATGNQSRREPRLHVVAATPVQPVTRDAREQGIFHPSGSDRIGMAAQHQRSSRAG